MNTLFNDMRGGIFLDHDRIPWGDWVHFLHERNHPCEKNNQSWVESRPRESWIDRTTLLKEISERNDSNLMRIGLEYLPVWFGRRHGDPSRRHGACHPWAYPRADGVAAHCTAGLPAGALDLQGGR